MEFKKEKRNGLKPVKERERDRKKPCFGCCNNLLGRILKCVNNGDENEEFKNKFVCFVGSICRG